MMDLQKKGGAGDGSKGEGGGVARIILLDKSCINLGALKSGEDDEYFIKMN